MTGFAANPFLPLFGEPQRIAALTAAEWERLLRLAQRCGLGLRLATLVTRAGIEDRLPPRALLRLDLALSEAVAQAEALRFDLAAVEQALADLAAPIVWLNAIDEGDTPPLGAAAAPRIELLVPPAFYGQAEARLAAAGWRAEALAGPQGDLRRRAGEIPPLVHGRRETIVDLRHALLPPDRRGRNTSPAPLFAAASAGPRSRWLSLSPHDRVLIAATRLFAPEAEGVGLAALLELADLIERFRDRPGFWEGLVPRAQALRLTGPLFHALRYLRGLLHIGIPAHVLADGARVAELTWLCNFLDWAAPRAALSAADRPADWQGRLARRLLDWRHARLRLTLPAFALHVWATRGAGRAGTV